VEHKCPFCGAPEIGLYHFSCGTMAMKFYLDDKQPPEEWKISATCLSRMQEKVDEERSRRYIPET